MLVTGMVAAMVAMGGGAEPGARTFERAPVGSSWVAYEDTGGQGPVVLCLPGMGDVRGEYRFLAPRLQAAGYRVLTADLRGHGDSGLGFASYRPEDVGRDALAILDHAGVRAATLVGCSMAAGSVAWAAAEAPDRVQALVMLGPAARDGEAGPFKRAMWHGLYRALFARPWGPSVWSSFYATLYKQTKPQDLSEYQAGLRRMIGQPGRLEALRAMILASKRPVSDRLGSVQAPTLLVMGGADPDFANPPQEAETLRRMMGGKPRVEVLEGLGHYPHVERPEKVMELMRQVLPEVAHGS